MQQPTQRFSDRVEDYVKYRPHYPPELTGVLRDQLGLLPSWLVADIGSGTGVSTLPFLENGNRVLAVEPNEAMRQAAEALLQENPLFRSINGSAENTTLEDHSIDLIFSGQAFHWFNNAATKAEFDRILKKDGHMVIAWNERDVRQPFQQAYEAVMQENLEEYKTVNHKNITADVMAGFFAPRPMTIITLTHAQEFDEAGLKGRLLSSSYCPKSGPVHDRLMEAIHALFRQYNHKGEVRFDYVTHIYCG